MACVCGAENHRDQINLYPFGAAVVTIAPIVVLYYEIPVGCKGHVSAHADDGRAYILFDNNSDLGGHTFHYPADYIRTESDISPETRALAEDTFARIEGSNEARERFARR